MKEGHDLLPNFLTPHPVATAVLPKGMSLLFATHSGLIVSVKSTGLGSFTRAMSFDCRRG